MKEQWICSENCGFTAYTRYIESIRQDSPILLLNEANIGVELREDLQDNPRGISIGPLKIEDGREILKGNKMAPEVVPLYKRIKEDLVKRKRVFKEECETLFGDLTH